MVGSPWVSGMLYVDASFAAAGLLTRFAVLWPGHGDRSPGWRYKHPSRCLACFDLYAGYISDHLQFWQSAIVMAGVVLLPQFPLVGVYIYERVRKGRMH